VRATSGLCATTKDALGLSAAYSRRSKRKGEVLCGMRISSTGSLDGDIVRFDGKLVVPGFHDNSRREVAMLWNMLRQVVGHTSASGTTRQGKPLPSARGLEHLAAGTSLSSPMFKRHLGAQASERRLNEDKLHSALFHWKNNLAAKAFRCWQFAHEMRKTKRSPPHGKGARVQTQVGLRNLGNTCYINAVLQALVAVPTFRHSFSSGLQGPPSSVDATVPTRRRRCLLEDEFADNSAVHGGGEASLTRELAELMRVISANKLVRRPSLGYVCIWKVVLLLMMLRAFLDHQVRFSPDKIVRLVWKYFGSFRGFRQHDSAEILVRFRFSILTLSGVLQLLV